MSGSAERASVCLVDQMISIIEKQYLHKTYSKNFNRNKNQPAL